MINPTQATIQTYLETLYPSCLNSDDALLWPPDGFALASSLLKASGGYIHVLKNWPAILRENPTPTMRWEDRCRELAAKWRAHSVAPKINPMPVEIQRWWQMVRDHANVPLFALGEEESLCAALIAIVVVSDETCEAVGIPIIEEAKKFGRRSGDPVDPYQVAFLIQATFLLTTQQTLTQRILHGALAVFPKKHTPQTGLTLRSLSHHLALLTGQEVVPRYHFAPWDKRDTTLNVLLAPWPFQVRPCQFKSTRGDLPEMPERFRFVAYDPSAAPNYKPFRVESYLNDLIKQTKEYCQEVHMVVFPELSLTKEEWDRVEAIGKTQNIMVVAGVLEKPEPKEGKALPFNRVRLSLPFLGKAGFLVKELQDKHHRWQVDANQIRMYGLGGNLDVNHNHWEAIQLSKRIVNFVALSQDFLFCCLICEDLARQDPVADMLRAVGPNLVLALLMDGPQLGVRWPARYATVLAEDPGSSVLTLTCAGMVDLTDPPALTPRRRTIGLWREANGSHSLRELDLPVGASGLLLSLTRERQNEFSADGREDRCTASFPRLSAVHSIFSKIPE